MDKTQQIFRFLKGNIYFNLIKRVLVVYLLFSLCRLGFYLYNVDLYKERSLGELLVIFSGGLRFDTTAIFYTNILYILMYLVPFKFRYNSAYQSIAKYLYFITNGIALAANCADIVYFRFTMRRTTFDFFREFQDNTNMGSIFASALTDYWQILLLFAGLAALMAWMYGPRIRESAARRRHAASYLASSLGAMILGFGIMLVGLRGGVSFRLLPITVGNAGEYATAAIDVPLIVNTPFSIYKTLERTGIRQLRYFPDGSAALATYSPDHYPEPDSSFTGENVVVIILESFGREVFKSYNPGLDGGNYQGYPVFLDSLIRHGRTFMYGNSNGRKSIDVMPAAFCGIPSIPESFVLSGYYNNYLNTLPEMLGAKGYETAFFCGHPDGTMGYSYFCRLIGIRRYYGQAAHGNDRDSDGVWGIWDEEFLQFTAGELGRLPQPFFSTVYTVSSHHPYLIPEKYETLLKPEKLPLYRSIRYTDHALRRFFKSASAMPWFNNTLFVIMADHPGELLHDEYKNPAGFFAIPIIFYRPDGSLARMEHDVAQHTDVMPTILSYLNYDRPYFSFGFDLNSRKTEHFAVNSMNGMYQTSMGQYILLFDGQKSTGLYDLKADPAMRRDVSSQLPGIAADMELKTKAFLQQYTTRMVENKLTVNP
jgi:phosphoglycerol transferase MdoB-like AlkP superfamily enzyme